MHSIKRFSKKAGIVLFSVLFFSTLSFAKAGEAYLNNLISFSLIKGSADYYEAYVVSRSIADTPEGVLAMLRPICSEFPKLDTYVVKVFTDSSFANYENAGNNKYLFSPSKELMSSFWATLGPNGTLMFFPVDKTRRKTHSLPSKNWCNYK